MRNSSQHKELYTLPQDNIPYCLYTDKTGGFYCVPLSHPWICCRVNNTVVGKPKTYGYARPEFVGIMEKPPHFSRATLIEELGKAIAQDNNITAQEKNSAINKVKQDIQTDQRVLEIIRFNPELDATLKNKYGIDLPRYQETNPLIPHEADESKSSCCLII